VRAAYSAQPLPKFEDARLAQTAVPNATADNEKNASDAFAATTGQVVEMNGRKWFVTTYNSGNEAPDNLKLELKGEVNQGRPTILATDDMGQTTLEQMDLPSGIRVLTARGSSRLIVLTPVPADDTTQPAPPTQAPAGDAPANLLSDRVYRGLLADRVYSAGSSSPVVSYFKALDLDYLSGVASTAIENSPSTMVGSATIGHSPLGMPGLNSFAHVGFDLGAALTKGAFSGNPSKDLKRSLEDLASEWKKEYVGGIPVVGKLVGLWGVYNKYAPEGWEQVSPDKRGEMLGHATLPAIGLVADLWMAKGEVARGASFVRGKAAFMLEGELVSRGLLEDLEWKAAEVQWGEKTTLHGGIVGGVAPRRGLYQGLGQVINPRPDARALAGLRDRCTPAAGATVLRLLGRNNVTTKEIWKAAGAPIHGMHLSNLVNAVNTRVAPGAQWKVRPQFTGVGQGTDQSLRNVVAHQGADPWIAGVTYGSDTHTVVVERVDFLNREVHILDPQPMANSSGILERAGTSYRMSFEAFFLDWDGEVVLTR